MIFLQQHKNVIPMGEDVNKKLMYFSGVSQHCKMSAIIIILRNSHSLSKLTPTRLILFVAIKRLRYKLSV